MGSQEYLTARAGGARRRRPFVPGRPVVRRARPRRPPCRAGDRRAAAPSGPHPVIFTAHSLPERIARDGRPLSGAAGRVGQARGRRSRASTPGWSRGRAPGARPSRGSVRTCSTSAPARRASGAPRGRRLPDRLRRRPPRGPLRPRRRGRRASPPTPASPSPGPLVERRPGVHRRPRRRRHERRTAPTMTAPRSVVVVGGGIGGLAAAWELTGGAEPTRRRAGGRRARGVAAPRRPALHRGVRRATRSTSGPTGSSGRRPEAAELCHEVGLGDALVPIAARAPPCGRGAGCARLPEGQALGMPTRFWPTARSGILGLRGQLALARDALAPAPRRPRPARRPRHRAAGGAEARPARRRRRWSTR